MLLKESFKDPLMQVIKAKQIFNKISDKPAKVPFLHDILKGGCSSLLFILSDTIQKTGTALKLLKIDTKNRNIDKPNESIDGGIAVA